MPVLYALSMREQSRYKGEELMARRNLDAGPYYYSSKVFGGGKTQIPG